ncbi:MAG: hypothetical protein RL376_1396, partial [Verrucomicrobiota bacterium]
GLRIVNQKPRGLAKTRGHQADRAGFVSGDGDKHGE